MSTITKKNIWYKILFFSVSVMLLPTGIIFAQSEEQKGFDISARSDRSDRNFGKSKDKFRKINTR